MITLVSRTTDEVELVSVADPAIDLEASDVAAWDERLELSALRFTGEPTIFRARPLSEHEKALVLGAGASVDGRLAPGAATSFLAFRLGVQSIKNPDLKLARERWSAGTILTEDAIAQIPGAVTMEIGGRILQLSGMLPPFVSPWRSSRGNTGRPAGVGTSTAPAASSTDSSATISAAMVSPANPSPSPAATR